MKTKEELQSLQQEVSAVREKLAELSEDELAEVSGGVPIFPILLQTVLLTPTLTQTVFELEEISPGTLDRN